MSRVGMILTGRTKPGRRADLYALFEEHLAPRALANPDQPVVVWMADAADPETFHLFELYRDRDAMEANGQAAWFGAYMAASGPLLDGEPVLYLAEARWAKGVEIE